jgi:tRNA modification GTPase
VFDQPGTTRDVVTGQTAFEGWPFQLADTAGIRNTTDELEQAGIERARRTAEAADLLCLLLDTSQPATAEDLALLDEFSNPARNNRPPVIIVAHKADLPNRWAEPLPDDAMPISSTTGDGVENLMTAIVQTLIPLVPSTGTPVPISQRQIQWLNRARQALATGDAAQAVAAIRNCLSGSPFESDSPSK